MRDQKTYLFTASPKHCPSAPSSHPHTCPVPVGRTQAQPQSPEHVAWSTREAPSIWATCSVRLTLCGTSSRVACPSKSGRQVGRTSRIARPRSPQRSRASPAASCHKMSRAGLPRWWVHNVAPRPFSTRPKSVAYPMLWWLRQVAIQGSRFNDVLYLDTDSCPVRDPDFLFDTKAYRSTGVVAECPVPP